MAVFDPETRRALQEALGGGGHYYKRLKAANFEVTPDDYAAHLNWLKVILPVIKTLKGPNIRQALNDSNMFSSQEQRTVYEAVKILENTAIARVLLKKKKDDDIVLF